MNTTKSELYQLVRDIDTLRQILAIDPDLVTYQIDMGSATNGIAFRIYGLREGETGHAHVDVCSGDRGYLGMTKNEASDKLRTIRQALRAAVSALTNV